LKERPQTGYTTAEGVFFNGSEKYLLEAFKEHGETGSIAAKLHGKERTVTQVLRCQPRIIDGCLCVSSMNPELPESSEQVKAFAVYLLQLPDEEQLRYTP